MAAQPTAGVVLDGEGIAAALTASGLPIAEVRVFTPETDPERALGLPNQYVGKVSWLDTRVGEDATIEVFATLANLEARRRLLLARNNREGRLLEYIVARQDRRALLRVPGVLTQEQASAYESWFESL